MNRLVINGGRRLSGEINVSGSKNAALALIFSALAIEGETVLLNVSDIGDVRVAIKLISSLGAKVEFASGRLLIDASTLEYSPPDRELTSRIRASTYLLGASLARFGRFGITAFGGCNFSSRPIDLHIKAALSLGADLIDDTLSAKELRGGKIVLEKPSVGATVNAVIMATHAVGRTEIYGFAKEPHVLSVISFFRAAGADISIENEKIMVAGGGLHSVRFKVIGDMIEAGTYLAFALVTDGEIKIKGFYTEELSSFFSAVRAMGYRIKISKSELLATATGQLPAVNIPFVTARPYPGFPTDLQPIIVPLMAKNRGGTVADEVWRGRFGYLDSLSPFGIAFEKGESLATVKSGITSPATVKAPDLRGGASCIAAALAVNGRTEIYSPEIILRGYENITEKLTSLGADIKLEAL